MNHEKPDKPHRHSSPLRGTKVIPRPAADNPLYHAVNYAYAGQQGNIHEVVMIGRDELAKVGFPDKKIVYYLLSDLENSPRITIQKGSTPTKICGKRRGAAPFLPSAALFHT